MPPSEASAAAVEENAAWVDVELPLSPDEAFEFASNLERLFRLNPYLDIDSWQEEPGPCTPGKHYRLRALNEMNGLRCDLTLSLVSIEPGRRLMLVYDRGIKRALEVSVERRGPAGSALTLKDHYHAVEGPDREERLKEVDRSLTPWGMAIRRHVLARKRWGWPFRRLADGFWLRMNPRQRRIGRLLIWITALEFAVFLLVVGVFWAESR